MKLKNIIAVSGLANLTELVATKNSGLILKDLNTKKTNFYTVRKFQFTPLETVGIYTMTDTIDLKVVFKTIKDKMEEIPIIPSKSTPKELAEYFSKILPDFDRDKVYPSDIKKVIRWFVELNELGYLEEEAVEEEAAVEEGN